VVVHTGEAEVGEGQEPELADDVVDGAAALLEPLEHRAEVGLVHGYGLEAGPGRESAGDACTPAH
jgi:hypothetical protein